MWGKFLPIPIDVNRKSQPSLKVTEEERGLLRGLIGSLQYAATNTRPDLASRLSALQSAISHATIETLWDANRLLHEAKKYHDMTLTIRPISTMGFRFMAFSDASFASSKKPDSHAGLIIVGTHKDISSNKQCPISPISWSSKKIQKVVTSTLSAETTSLAAAMDQLSWLRIFWQWLLDPSTQWKKPEDTLPNIPQAISVSTKSEDHDVAVTDCKSLYDLVTRTAPPACSEFRVQLVARAIKEAMKEGTTLRWAHSGANLLTHWQRLWPVIFCERPWKKVFSVCAMKIQLCGTVLRIAIESDGSVKDRTKARMSSQHKVFTSVNVSFQLPSFRFQWILGWTTYVRAAIRLREPRTWAG